jgi:hypothetical protein
MSIRIYLGKAGCVEKEERQTKYIVYFPILRRGMSKSNLGCK